LFSPVGGICIAVAVTVTVTVVAVTVTVTVTVARGRDRWFVKPWSVREMREMHLNALYDGLDM